MCLFYLWTHGEFQTFFKHSFTSNTEYILWLDHSLRCCLCGVCSVCVCVGGGYWEPVENGSIQFVERLWNAFSKTSLSIYWITINDYFSVNVCRWYGTSMFNVQYGTVILSLYFPYPNNFPSLLLWKSIFIFFLLELHDFTLFKPNIFWGIGKMITFVVYVSHTVNVLVTDVILNIKIPEQLKFTYFI